MDRWIDKARRTSEQNSILYFIPIEEHKLLFPTFLHEAGTKSSVAFKLVHKSISITAFIDHFHYCIFVTHTFTNTHSL